MTPSQKQNALTSIGVYYHTNQTQQIGYWLVPGSERNQKNENFVSVCIFPVNSQFQSVLFEAAKKELESLLNVTFFSELQDTFK